MVMFDYDLLGTLAAVVREGSFEIAAAHMNISQSAVSQRIKTLENRVGSTLVVRGRPCIATPLGRRLCAHVDNVALLEHGLRDIIQPSNGGAGSSRTTVPIAVNADSLATWFPEVVAKATDKLDLLFDLIPDDQEHTSKRLLNGDAIAAVSGNVPNINGFRKTSLGSLDYITACKRDVWEQYFADGITRDTIAKLPCLVFDRKDSIPSQWLASYGLSYSDLDVQWIPSFSGYIRAVSCGAGWGIVPRIALQEELGSGRIVEMAPSETVSVPLFWMSSIISNEIMDRFSRLLMSCARRHLTL
jgi:LysR family transcriptional regulator (chromosome initiation inhibitor)